MPFRGTYASLRSEPTKTKGGSTSPSARCCGWVGASLDISTDWENSWRVRTCLLRRTWGAGRWEVGHEPKMWSCRPESKLYRVLHPKRGSQQGPFQPKPLHESMKHNILCWSVNLKMFLTLLLLEFKFFSNCIAWNTFGKMRTSCHDSAIQKSMLWGHRN